MSACPKHKRDGAVRRTVRLPLAMLAPLLLAGSVSAQTRGCSMTPYTDPPREVLACPDGLTITAERGAAYRLLDRNRDGRPDAAELTNRGLLIDVPPGRRGGFQILTPHAIASVRGTVWAVDVGADRSSVFVREGAVAVSRREGRATAPVVLGPGDGVDVEDVPGPLTVTKWGTQRAAGLLARFGR